MTSPISTSPWVPAVDLLLFDDGPHLQIMTGQELQGQHHMAAVKACNVLSGLSRALETSNIWLSDMMWLYTPQNCCIDWWKNDEKQGLSRGTPFSHCIDQTHLRTTIHHHGLQSVNHPPKNEGMTMNNSSTLGTMLVFFHFEQAEELRTLHNPQKETPD